MLLKGMTLFLVVMGVLAMFGKLRLPGRGKKTGRWIGRAPRAAQTCPRCGRPQIGPGPCPCTHIKNKGA